MAEKVLLPQSAPGATTLTEVFQAEPTGVTVLNSFTVCNRSTTPTSFRVAVSPSGGSISNENYIAYDVPIPGAEVYGRELGMALPPGAIIRVYATLATLSFSFSILRRG